MPKNNNKEIITDFGKRKTTNCTELSINREEVEHVTNSELLGVHIWADLSWCVNKALIIRTTQQCLFFLRILRQNKFPPALLLHK